MNAPGNNDVENSSNPTNSTNPAFAAYAVNAEAVRAREEKVRKLRNGLAFASIVFAMYVWFSVNAIDVVIRNTCGNATTTETVHEIGGIQSVFFAGCFFWIYVLWMPWCFLK